MLVVIRHGNTPFLKGEKRIEGWGKIPLTEDGKKQVEKTANKIKDLYLPYESFESSDLLRTKQTSDTIAKKIGMDYTESSKLRTWNPGIFEGRLVDDNIDKLNSFIDNPHETVPGSGKSYSDFYNTVKPVLLRKIESDKVHLITTHNRVATLIKSLEKSKGEFPDLNILHGKGPIKTGGIMIIHPDWKVDVIDGADTTKGE